MRRTLATNVSPRRLAVEMCLVPSESSRRFGRTCVQTGALRVWNPEGGSPLYPGLKYILSAHLNEGRLQFLNVVTVATMLSIARASQTPRTVPEWLFHELRKCLVVKKKEMRVATLPWNLPSSLWALALSC